MPTFRFGTTDVDYSVRHQPDKPDITIAVDWTNGLSVVAPEGIEHQQIEATLKRKARWILRKLAEFEEIRPSTTKYEFISGEKFPYLGRQYRLTVLKREDVDDVTMMFQNGRFVATTPSACDAVWREERFRRAFRQWCISHGHPKVQQRIELFAPRLGLHPSKVVVKDQQSRWGSCTKNGTININWKVLMAPMRIVDYVVVHELGHMVHADHSSEFWTVVSSVMPDYDERKEWLRVHGPTLYI